MFDKILWKTVNADYDSYTDQYCVIQRHRIWGNYRILEGVVNDD